MTTKLTYVALAGAFCLAIVGTATTLSDSDKATVITPSEKGTITVSQNTKPPKGNISGKSDRF